MRDPNVVENMTATGTQFDVGGPGGVVGAGQNRLRLQAVWDGFRSCNGSRSSACFKHWAGAATGVNGMSDS